MELGWVGFKESGCHYHMLWHALNVLSDKMLKLSKFSSTPVRWWDKVNQFECFCL